ncbi:cellulose biosynthesis protein BcsP [Bordetella genomosp. 13]|uniref:Cellulose biosynthesis protein BcsR n=1 Tax=Bordetella genomosp. 13 TaxID=463040 RepID=A0A1W6ZIH8_9BORD|nr:cellulose biosynthesis protein BcsP [Bordetella genomosp. 13]ARP97161.1 hypothetical protein CAL15_23985 [Bordetella genomosp. 13]
MNDASDISSLYQRFGGDADQYLELGQSNHAQASRERWPLLSAIRPELAMVPPAVGERVEATHAVSPWASAVSPPAPPVPVPSIPAAPPAPAVTPTPAAEDAPAVAPAAPATPSAEPRPSLQNVFARLAQSGSSSSKP